MASPSSSQALCRLAQSCVCPEERTLFLILRRAPRLAVGWGWDPDKAGISTNSKAVSGWTGLGRHGNWKAKQPEEEG